MCLNGCESMNKSKKEEAQKHLINQVLSVKCFCFFEHNCFAQRHTHLICQFLGLQTLECPIIRCAWLYENDKIANCRLFFIIINSNLYQKYTKNLDRMNIVKVIFFDIFYDIFTYYYILSCGYLLSIKINIPSFTSFFVNQILCAVLCFFFISLSCVLMNNIIG